ncbi:response regulator [Diaphorobacter aerolatus]|uniref:Response regulator transcription factor n=1 Tax=Diaphorobacter aerolatus TaxID=1288495 RepID=A0A7H0GMW1_9BURK|nr:response regulator transcription factor [Diaphorobacter aerolatus]QNP49627.1 response regulator transcription factor [Diaphorobacter aerolatus]
MTITNHTIRVLLVDDHPLVRDGVRMRLEATPHIRVVAEAGCADEAFALAGTALPDIVLTDIRMPGASGIQLTARFREHHPLVRVLVLSMHHDEEYVRRAMALGASGYVLKDSPAQQLVEAIERVHAGRMFLSPAIETLLHAQLDDVGNERSNRTLTPREATVLQLLAQGRSNKEIAELMGSSVRTVETHRLHLRRKLRIDGRAALVKYAVDHADLQMQPSFQA